MKSGTWVKDTPIILDSFCLHSIHYTWFISPLWNTNPGLGRSGGGSLCNCRNSPFAYYFCICPLRILSLVFSQYFISLACNLQNCILLCEKTTAVHFWLPFWGHNLKIDNHPHHTCPLCGASTKLILVVSNLQNVSSQQPPHWGNNVWTGCWSIWRVRFLQMDWTVASGQPKANTVHSQN